MRQIVLDTETTGFDPAGGDRIVEIACLELVNKVPTGKNFRKYINPERDMPSRAEQVHGLSQDFLADKPLFADIVGEFLEFIADAPLIIHNAVFDLGFLNAELARLDRPALDEARAIDTLGLARRKFPGAQASLDALCRRFEIDLSGREKHGALLDVELLAQVYLELTGGRQPSLGLQVRASEGGAQATASSAARSPRPARQHQPDADERTHHDTMLTRLTDPIWLK